MKGQRAKHEKHRTIATSLGAHLIVRLTVVLIEMLTVKCTGLMTLMTIILHGIVLSSPSTSNGNSAKKCGEAESSLWQSGELSYPNAYNEACYNYSPP